jgi:nucleotide-binding universal stress UspA family protein
MSIKRILVPIPGSADLAGEIDMALSAAKALTAHVEALFITQPPPPRTGDMPFRRNGGSAATSVNWWAEDQDRLARAAQDRFVEACNARAVPIAITNETMTDEAMLTLPAASWQAVEGSYVAIAAQRAAAFDLIVAASGVVMEALQAIAEQALLRTRRPVLLSPARAKTDLTDPAMIAWDESPECWHAVSAAIPFLKLAKSVQVVSVDSDAAHRRASHEEVLAYLRCHGVEAKAQVVEPVTGAVGDTLLSVAGDDAVGLVVMGAYSHSRLREMIFGGVTRYMLQNAAARPVLLAH